MSHKFWDNYTYRAHVRMIERDPDKLISYIAKNLRSMANIGRIMAGYCGTGGFGENPPDRLDGEVIDNAIQISSAEVALSQLSMHLAIACAAALDNSVMPSMALKDESRGSEHMNDFTTMLDEYGSIFNAYQREKFHFTKRSEQARSITDYAGDPWYLSWDLNDDLRDQALRHLIASNAFDNARDNIISVAIMRWNDIRED
mgnify:CR=1 FL=1